MKSLSLAEELEKSEKNEKMQEKEFWERLGNVITPQHSEVWEVTEVHKSDSLQILEKELIKYHQLLSDRVKLLQETEGIKHQNDQLKQLLNTYISSSVFLLFMT